jgi:hypothetical protein
MILEYIISIAALLIFAGVFILPAVYLMFGKNRERKREAERAKTAAELLGVPLESANVMPAAAKSGRELMDHIDDFAFDALSSSLKERYEEWDNRMGLAETAAARPGVSRLKSLPELKKAVVMAEILGPPKAFGQD